LAGSTSKKIVAVRFDREPMIGFINSLTYLQAGGVELLTTSGAVLTVPYQEIKALCFVRDFENVPVWKEHRAFPSRPKLEGLWVKIRFRDGDTLEGLAANNLLQVEEHGLNMATPDPGFQNRVFIPREAATHMQVLGVVGRPLRRTGRSRPASQDQLRMFE
jgi:hypothetical protein